MKRSRRFSKFAFLGLALAALEGFAQNAAAPDTHGIIVANMDRAVKPGDDFYHFANGDWIKRTEIPPDRAGVDVWSRLEDLSDKRTADLIEEIAKSNAPAGSGARKGAGPFQFLIEAAGLETKKPGPFWPHLGTGPTHRD